MIWTESYNRPYVADTTTYNIIFNQRRAWNERGGRGEERMGGGGERERERREEEKERERRTQIKLSSS